MTELRNDEVQIWDFFMAGILSMNCHPGTTRDAAPGRTMEEMAQIALDAVEERRKHLPKGWIQR